MVVYKQYDQSGLDRQYNNRLQTPDHAIHTDQWAKESKQTEKAYNVVKDIVYGSNLRERLDVYPSGKPFSRTLVFIHGGYWRSMDKSSFQFVAGAFHSYSITTVLITYPLAPDVSIDQIVSSCRRALDWVYKNSEAYNGDPGQVYIAGHSAGGHLAAMLLVEEINNTCTIKGACALSGLFNLVPVQRSEINASVQMDSAMALRNSPVELLPKYKCPLLLAVGADETDEFKAQSREMYERWNMRLPVQLMEIEGANHYSILTCFTDHEAELHKTVCRMMNLY